MAPKSAAQIRRLQKRAEERGEEYHYSPPSEQPEEEKGEEGNGPQEEKTSSAENSKESAKLVEIATRLKKELQEIDENEEMKSKDRRSAKRKVEAVAAEDSGMGAPELLEWYETNSKKDSTGKKSVDPKATKLAAAASKLQKELETIDKTEDLKSKDRRSAKRKAEAIAAEEAGMPVEELLDWYKEYVKSKPSKSAKGKRAHDPYIAFVGQISFQTTREELFTHIQSNLDKEHKVTNENVKIRVLTDQKTKKSRGMAFIEVQTPDLLYALLKLHQTFLNGRRMNIERSAGGSKNSQARKDKITQYRKEQEDYFGEVVDNILNEYKKTGELREDELDTGVVSLCKRHSGPVVEAAVSKYIEGGGRDMDNSSAYLTFLLTKLAEEGVYDDDENTKHSQKPKRKGAPPSSSSGDGASKKFKSSSKFSKSGIDMSISQKTGDITKIFPSARRGRGYMM